MTDQSTQHVSHEGERPETAARTDDPETDDESGGQEVECIHCEYQWTYTGDLAKATCPSCGRKTPVSTDDD